MRAVDYLMTIVSRALSGNVYDSILLLDPQNTLYKSFLTCCKYRKALVCMEPYAEPTIDYCSSNHS